jgi:hypothetical protein
MKKFIWLVPVIASLILTLVIGELLIRHYSFSAPVSVDAGDTINLKEARERLFQEYKIDKIPDVQAEEKVIEAVLAKPLAEQTVDELEESASKANTIGNLIGTLLEGYKMPVIENSRYDFVMKTLAPAHDAYAEASNRFLDYRNQAYFNLGLKAKEKGETMMAYLYFRDAFRLSNFECDKGQKPESCMRWKAEQELQKLFGLSIKSYVTWQK